jgi:hypothetical protein
MVVSYQMRHRGVLCTRKQDVGSEQVLLEPTVRLSSSGLLTEEDLALVVQALRGAVDAVAVPGADVAGGAASYGAAAPSNGGAPMKKQSASSSASSTVSNSVSNGDDSGSIGSAGDVLLADGTTGARRSTRQRKPAK